jgi:uncharacterized PurR-regulated membrane protein YhhQ (DUF165 family)
MTVNEIIEHLGNVATYTLFGMLVRLTYASLVMFAVGDLHDTRDNDDANDE